MSGAMPVTTSSTISPRSSRTNSARARVWANSMFSERGQRRCCNAARVTRASEELSSFTMRMSRSALPPGNEPFDFTFNHQRQNLFLAQSQDAEDDRRDGHDRTGEQRPHEEAAVGEKAHHGLKCF